MSLRGYSFHLVKANQEADTKKNIGVLLGRVCIDTDVPVSKVAKYFKVSRMTVYSWFVGKSVPHKNTAEKIKKLLDKLLPNAKV
jgi:hypothetical protein